MNGSSPIYSTIVTRVGTALCRVCKHSIVFGNAISKSSSDSFDGATAPHFDSCSFVNGSM